MCVIVFHQSTILTTILLYTVINNYYTVFLVYNITFIDKSKLVKISWSEDKWLKIRQRQRQGQRWIQTRYTISIAAYTD